jgi:RNA polymerase sigma-70 factor (ECF subfamily)
VALLDVKLDGMPVRLERREELSGVFEQYAPAVSYFFARRGFSSEDCRDLTQETFLKAFRGLPRFRREVEIKTWILRIAANVWKNTLRSRQAVKRAAPTVSLELAVERGEVPETPGPTPCLRPKGNPGPLERMLLTEGQRMLREAVDELPPRMRRCVLLRIDQGLKYQEIAAILQVSEDTVKTQLYQARQRLKHSLDDYFSLSEGA